MEFVQKHKDLFDEDLPEFEDDEDVEEFLVERLETAQNLIQSVQSNTR